MIGTLQDLKDYIGEEKDASDERLTACLTRASALVTSYCRRKSFEQVTLSNELYDGPGTDVLILDNWPVTAVSELKEYGTILTVGTDPTANPDVLLYGDEGMLIKQSGIFFRARRWYKASYTAGYTAATMPGPVLQGALELAALLVREKDRIGIQSKTTGQQTTQMIRELSKPTMQGLDYYRDLALNRKVA